MKKGGKKKNAVAFVCKQGRVQQEERGKEGSTEKGRRGTGRYGDALQK